MAAEPAAAAKASSSGDLEIMDVAPTDKKVKASASVAAKPAAAAAAATATKGKSVAPAAATAATKVVPATAVDYVDLATTDAKSETRDFVAPDVALAVGKLRALGVRSEAATTAVVKSQEASEASNNGLRGSRNV